MEKNMLNLLVFGGGATTGYLFAIYTWPALRAAVVGAEQELASLRSRATDLETKMRAALGRIEH
jgi:hypothetical protein